MMHDVIFANSLIIASAIFFWTTNFSNVFFAASAASVSINSSIKENRIFYVLVQMIVVLSSTENNTG